MRRALVHATYLGLSLLFASRFFPIAHPTSFAITEGDPALMCWSLQWVSRALTHDLGHVFGGNTFFPYTHAVVLSDSMLSLAVLNAPVRVFTTNPWVGYDLLIVLAYYLSCVWGAWLARELTGNEITSAWAGVFWGFLFFRVHHIGHLQILSCQAIPAVAAASLCFWKRPTIRSALLVAVLFVAQALVSWYLACAEAVILIVLALCQPWRVVFTRKTAIGYALISAIAIAVLVPVALPYRAAFGDSTLSERQALVNSFGDAVHIADYLTPPSPTLAGRLIPDNQHGIWGENTLYIGYVALLLSAVSIFWRTAMPLEAGHDRKRAVLTGIALVLVGYVLSLGFVSPSLGIRLPMHYLARAVPSLAGLRATQRFAIVIYLGVLILSASGLTSLVRRWPARMQALACGIACAAFLIEVFPFSLPLHPDLPYEISAPDRAIAAYQRSRSTPFVVLHLPINYFREPYPVSEATYMLDSTAHWANILNGFSGGVPQQFMERMKTLNSLPDAKAVKLLFDLGVDVIAVHRGETRGESLRQFFDQQPWASINSMPTGEYIVLIDRGKFGT
ncbi:MAG TPA: hypothetical protein VLV86_00680 [Vicinamibacterales bacterium]|nr:hypothetical protein [Vicinamibacterales bacterium]